MAKLLRSIRRKPRRPRAGDVPGALVVDQTAPPSAISVIAYGEEELIERTVEDVAELADLAGSQPVVWVNVDGLGSADVLQQVARTFGMHPLALADVVNVPQRPKVDQYGQSLLIVTRMAAWGEHLETEQLSLYVAPGLVLTFQEHTGDCLEAVRDRIRHARGRIRQAGSDYLAYSLLDGVVDGYYPVLEELGERIEALEDRVIARPDPDAVAEIHQIKRDLLVVRRSLWPQRDAVSWLLREECPAISDETRLYLRDCADHLHQCIDLLETYRELASGLMDAYMSAVSNRMNEVMKVLTIIATIFIPLSFIAGLYGMNFNPEKSPWNMPELGWYLGYPLALAIMAAVGIGMLIYFRRKGWLGGGEQPPGDREKSPPAGGGQIPPPPGGGS